MTYEDIAKWSIEHIPMGQFDTYEEWRNEVEQEFINTGHFFPKQVYALIEAEWNKYHAGKAEFPEPSEEEGKFVRERIAFRIEKFPQDLEFSPKQLANFTGENKNTVRRELQQLVEEGTLQRISRGRYRKAP
jgi:Fic family protein